MAWKQTWNPQITMEDWLANNCKLRREFDTITDKCFSVRQEGKAACDDADIQTSWSLSMNNRKLEKSAIEIQFWKEEFSNFIITVENELELIKTEKTSTQRELDRLIDNFAAVDDCLSMRSKRKQVDMCIDYVQDNLRKELNMLEKVKQNLINNCEQANNQINRLFYLNNELKQRVRFKEEALNVEKTTLNLGTSPYELIGIYKQTDNGDDAPILKFISYESWLENCRDVKGRTEAELDDSKKLRSEMCLPRHFAHNEIESQYETTDYSFRKRIYEYNAALDELRWQEQKLTEERDILYEEINHLEETVHGEVRALKVAQAQNTNRLQKPDTELRQDECTDGMRKQARCFGNLIENLVEKLNVLKKSYGDIQNHIEKIEREITDKKIDVTIDKRCLDVRRGLLA